MYRSALAMILLAVTLSSAELPDDWKKISNLLKDFEYEVENKENSIKATHHDFLTIYVKGYKKGLLLQGYFSDPDVSERALRRLNNKLSVKATATRFYIDSDGDLMCEAWFPGDWDEDRFEIFLEAWHKDTDGQYDEIRDTIYD